MKSRYAFYDRYRWVFRVLILGMGLYFLYLGFQTGTEARLLATQGAATKGITVSKRIEHRRYNPDGLGATLHLVTYRYQVDGVEFVDEAGVPVARYETTGPGDAVAVHYARSAPQISELTRGSTGAKAHGIYLFGFVVLGMALLLVVVDQVRDRLRRRSGR
jgi:threonine/homoserine/homoserine lactone efflux protein